MSHAGLLLAIAGVYLAVVVSPGPNFLLVSQLALQGRMRTAAIAAIGIACGSTMWAMLAMAGVAALLTHVGWLYAAIRLAGAAYLVWFGIKLLIGALRGADHAEIAARPPMSTATAFRSGLVTNLTNPKAGAFWTSVFSSMYPADAPAWFPVAIVVMVPCIAGGWYIAIGQLLASDRVQRRYLRLRRLIDALCGTLLVAFGARIAAS